MELFAGGLSDIHRRNLVSRALRHHVHSLMLALAFGCVVPSLSCAKVDSPTTAEEELEQRAELKQDLLGDIKRVDEFIAETQRGENLSNMTLGWFAYSLLIKISEQDREMAAHFYDGDRDMGSYLKYVFAADPEGEIAYFDDLAQKGHPTLRLIARDMLKALHHIPDDKDSPEVQGKDRDTLVTVLTDVKGLLEKASDKDTPL